MTKKCECGHNKGQHEDTYDYGKNSGRCLIKNCECHNEIFGYTEVKAQ